MHSFNPRESNKSVFSLLNWRFHSEPPWKKKEMMAKWQQGEEDSFLEQVEELVHNLGCSLHLESNLNCYNWYEWNISIFLKHCITESSCGLWLLPAVPKWNYCITFVYENLVGVNSNKGTSCGFGYQTDVTHSCRECVLISVFILSSHLPSRTIFMLSCCRKCHDNCVTIKIFPSVFCRILLFWYCSRV